MMSLSHYLREVLLGLAFLSTITNLKHELKQMKTTGSTYSEHCKVLLLVVLEVVAKN